MQQVKEEETYSVINFGGETVRIPKDDDRALRRFCCGSTDVSKIMGTSSYAGPYDLYHSKLNDEIVDVSPQMKMGLLMEPVFRQLAQESLEYLGLDPSDEVIEGETFFESGFMYSSRSTPDALLKNNKAVCFEFKRHRYEMLDDYGDYLTNEVPPMEYDQVQWHMHHSGCEVCFVGVFFKGSDEMRWWRVERDEKRIKEIDYAAMTFFVNNLQAKVCPPVDATEGCLKRLKKLEQRDSTKRTFEGEEWQWAVEHDALKKSINELKKKKDEVEAKLRESMGEMQMLYVEEGKSKVTCKAPKNSNSRRFLVTIAD